MRRLALILVVFLQVVAGHTIVVDPAQTQVHAQRIRSTYPRPEASEGEFLVIQYVTTVLAQSDIEYQVNTFDSYPSGHSSSRIVEALIQGESADTVLIAVPLNHPEQVPPDRDRSPSLAAALALAQAGARERPALSLRFLFLGAEYGDAPTYPMGSQLALNGYYPEAPHAVVYLDASSTPLVIETGGGGDVAPPWLVTGVVQAAQETGVEPTVRSELNQLHRLSVSEEDPILTTYLSRDLATVVIRSGTTMLTAPDVATDAVVLARFLGAFVEGLGEAVPAEWDRHYLYFRIGSRQVIVGERAHLLALVLLVMLTLLYGLVARRRLTRYLRTVGRNIWNLPVLFLVVFGFISAGTILLDLFLVIRRFPTLWQFSPLAYTGIKLGLATFLFTLAAQLIRHLPLSKNGSFYSAAALFVLFIDIILFSALSLSVGYYFIWAFGFAFLFSVARYRWVKLICLVLAPFFLIRVAVEVLSIPDLAVSYALLLNPWGDLLLAFMILPFLLMLIRLDFLIRHPVRGRRSFALRLASIVAGSAVIGLSVFVTVREPYSDLSPQPVALVQTVDYTQLSHTYTVTSPAPMNDVLVTAEGTQHQVEQQSREWTLESNRLPDVLSLRLTTDQFLDRERSILSISAPQPLDEVFVRMESDEPMAIYDMSYPYSMAPDRRSAEVFVGKRPALPLIIEYTAAQGTMPQIRVQAQSRVLPEPVEISGPRIEATLTLVIRSRLGP